MWEEVDDEALADLFISTLTSSECTRFLDKFQQYRHNVCRAPATEIAPSPLLGEGREAPGEKLFGRPQLFRRCQGSLPAHSIRRIPGRLVRVEIAVLILAGRRNKMATKRHKSIAMPLANCVLFCGSSPF